MHRLWRPATTRECLFLVTAAHVDVVRCLEWTRDSDAVRLLSGGYDGALCVWGLDDGTRLVKRTTLSKVATA